MVKKIGLLILWFFVIIGCTNSQGISNNKGEILKKAKFVETLISNNDTVAISKINENSDPLGIRDSGYSLVIVSNYLEMKSEDKKLDYNNMKVNGVSEDGENRFLHVVIPAGKSGGMFLAFQLLGNKKMKLWDVKFSYVKKEDIVPMPSFD